MRIAPSAIESANLVGQEDLAGGIVAITTTTADNYSSTGCLGNFTVASASFTKFRPARILANNSTAAYIGFSAEF